MISFTLGEPNARIPDDLTGDEHRQLLGWIGLLLPFILIGIAIWRDGVAEWRNLDSISAYYYTGAVAAFVGMLVAFALFLLTYHGYDNAHNKHDRIVAGTAGAAALLVALFPTAAPSGVTALSWWRPWVGFVHYAAATTLFAMFATFALWLFRLRKDGKARLADGHDWTYLVCGLVIVACILLSGYNVWNGAPIFWPESFALIAFSVSWLVKGYAVDQALDRARRLFGLKSVSSS